MSTIIRMRGAIAACLLVAAGSAYADEPALTPDPSQSSCDPGTAHCPAPAPAPQPTAQPMPPPPPPEPVAMEQAWYQRVGWGLSAGGGVDDFVGGDEKDVTGI